MGAEIHFSSFQPQGRKFGERDLSGHRPRSPGPLTVASEAWLEVTHTHAASQFFGIKRIAASSWLKLRLRFCMHGRTIFMKTCDVIDICRSSVFSIHHGNFAHD